MKQNKTQPFSGLCVSQLSLPSETLELKKRPKENAALYQMFGNKWTYLRVRLLLLTPGFFSPVDDTPHGF